MFSAHRTPFNTLFRGRKNGSARYAKMSVGTSRQAIGEMMSDIPPTGFGAFALSYKIKGHIAFEFSYASTCDRGLLDLISWILIVGALVSGDFSCQEAFRTKKKN